MDNKYDKFGHRLALGAACSLFLVFTFVLYAPLKLYLENKDVLWFNFESTLTASLILSAVTLIIFTLILALPKRIVHTGLCCLVFALALGLFLQGNFLNIDYGSGVLDGSEIAWKDYTTYGAIDSAVWAACLAMPFAFWMVFRTQWRKILIFASIGLVLVQAVILTSQISNNSNNLSKVTFEVTRDGIYELSEDDNTVVFVLDSFDNEYLKKIKRDFPDYEERLGGFTQYDNTLASGSGTSIALPSLLTGEVYKNDTTYSSYLESIWDNGTVYSLLKKNDVDTRIFAQTAYFGTEAKDDIENIYDYMDTKVARLSMAGTIYKYAAYSYAPHYLKPYFWMDLDTISSYKSDNAYSLDDAQFYSDYVAKQGFSYTDSYSDCVRIYHLSGARTPYTLTKNTIKSATTTSLDEQIYGCFNCIFSMIEDMKNSGVYKNSTIIITANMGNKELTQNPLLLIKEAGSTKGYQTSDAPLSTYDLAPTLASKVTYDVTNYGSGKTYFDFEDDATRTRYFYLNTGENNKTRIEQYSTRSDAADTEQMRLLDSFYSSKKASKYRLGTSRTFAMDATANEYCIQGFCSTTGWSTALAGPQSQMVIPISSIPSDAEDIHVFFGVSNIHKASNCVIYANGKQVFSAKINQSFSNDGLNFTVPARLIGDDKTLRLRIVFPEISDDEFLIDQNKRTKTFSVQTFKMYTQ
ncbi:MAG: hypothetical protein IJD68_03200 [Ruminococcus sp.]|nr:hypothetical protein [Ruminococcus sp.]